MDAAADSVFIGRIREEGIKCSKFNISERGGFCQRYFKLQMNFEQLGERYINGQQEMSF